MSNTAPPSAAEYLATLPTPIQQRLVSIARTAIGLSRTEKEHAAVMFGAYGATVAIFGADEQIPAGSMIADLGVIVRAAQNEATREAVK